MSDITSQVPPQPADGQSDITAQVPPGARHRLADDQASSYALPIERRPRVWPAVILIALQWIFILSPRWLAPGTMWQFMIPFLTPLVVLACLTIWWLFFSRLRWWERPLILLSGVAMGVVAYFLYDPSFFGMAMLMIALPGVTTAWVAWLFVTPFLRWPIRCAGLLLCVALAWGYYGLLRFDGVDGGMNISLSWRWTKTAEEKFLADYAARKKTVVPATEDETLKQQAGDWPGFRGERRDGRLTGVRIATDWNKNPPKQLWKTRVGPGWGSFAVIGDRLYTQEQRDKDEVVVCYKADTGEELWVHNDAARFTEAVGGPGPRATPTFHDGNIYAYGATGRLNCLVATTGRVLWSRDVVTDTGAGVPQWGFASSPLVAYGLVSVFAGAPGGKSVAAYDATSGEPVWTAGEGQLSYCSPHLATLDGVEQILIATDAGVTAIQPTKGDVLWKHDWPSKDMARVIQPAILKDSDVLIGTGMGVGTRRIHVAKESADWSTSEVWTTKAIKPYFNDLVVYDNHLYGFDTSGMFTCVNLDDGKASWRERGYGSGQVLLLADQGLLLIVAETGEVALAEAKPDALKELGRFKAFESKTWNHPVVAHGKLFVRNGEEMACYQLTEDAGK